MCAAPVHSTCVSPVVNTTLDTLPQGSWRVQTWGHRDKLLPEAFSHPGQPLGFFEAGPGAPLRRAQAQETQLYP